MKKPKHNLETVIRLLDNYSLDIIADTSDADDFKESILYYLKQLEPEEKQHYPKTEEEYISQH